MSETPEGRDYRLALSFDELLADDDKVRALLDAKALEAAEQAGTIASLRQRQEELQAENDALGEQYAGASADYETLAASLRSQLQQAEQERDAHHKRASDNAKRASEAEHRERVLTAQLQQAETALELWRRQSEAQDVLLAKYRMEDFRTDAKVEAALDTLHETRAALAAPPADAWKNAQQRLRDFPGSPKEILPGDYPTSSQEKP